MEDQLNLFFKKSDEFLITQFKFSQGLLAFKDVVESQQNLISFLKNLNFNDEVFDKAKKKWINILNNLSVNIGFPHLENINPERSDLVSFLEDSRKKIDSKSFIQEIKKFTATKLSSLGKDLTISPNEWLKEKDVKISTSIDPEIFKAKLFEITKFDVEDRIYQFKRSLNGGFFMMSLHLSPTYCIGHGPLDSLFNLSTFAHELGHSTTHRERSLKRYFLDYPDEESEGIQINDEDDSYLYEKYFLENIDQLLSSFNIDLGDNLSALLLKRKAIQNNMHILKNNLNNLYYSGLSFDEIQIIFLKDMRTIYPSYTEVTGYDWLSYSTLDKPLSRLGYIKAYLNFFQYASLS